MQQNMPPMDGMKMEMHDTFWRNDQVTVVFRSDIPLISDGNHNTGQLLQKLDLPSQLQRLNQFLEENHVPASLPSYGDSSKLPPGVHHFGLTAAIPTDFGDIHTSVISFLKIGPARGAGGPLAERALPGNGHGSNNDESLIRTIVTTLNHGLGHLNRNSMVPIAFSAPAWLCGGTYTGQGCPLTPPMPVEDACSNWHIRLPDLDSRLKSKKGDGVTVFILDAFPERGVISRAARDAGNDNRLLSKVNDNKTVSFDYNLMSGVQEILDMASTGNAAVGKDVYGNHYPIRMPDHGLFIAGIVRDVAPKAKIECIRVLNDLCVGDLHKLVRALWRIYKRMLAVNPDTGQKGDLYQQPVVINLSLVIPTDEEAWQKQINPVVRGFNIIQAPLHSAITSLTQVGAIVVASAGNEGDLREMGPEGKRPMALYPAAFGESIDNVIAVGAVTSTDTATAASYSCYPGSRGIATYGGEVPAVQPLDPPSSNPVVTIKDALRGIYSSVEYPPLSAVPADPPEQYYAAPNDHAWAYWIGTSFATPIVSAVAARILELKATGTLTGSVHDAIMNTASKVVTWDNLDPSIGVPGGTTTGPMLKAIQVCKAEDSDDGDDNDDVEVVN
jgi:hypothetical protein